MSDQSPPLATKEELATNNDLNELFESARSLWQEGELRASWNIYERIFDLLRPVSAQPSSPKPTS